MSTELVAIERITIRKGDSNADDIRSCLAHYLLQFINSASIESLSMHKLSIKFDGKTVLFVQDKTGGVGLKGLDTDWQHTPEMSAILDQLVTDVDEIDELTDKIRLLSMVEQISYITLSFGVMFVCMLLFVTGIITVGVMAASVYAK